MTTLAELFPVLGLRITAGPLELRGLTDDVLPDLVALVERGIHPPDQMPFSIPWTAVPAEDLARNTVQYHWGARAQFSPEDWGLHLGVWFEGVLVGSQSLLTENYLVTRSGETGSWLGREHQGQGIGRAMRRAVCAFAFDHLDAVEITSGAFVDNPASMAVSRAVGYRRNGVRRVQRRPGELAELVELVLTPGSFVRGEHPLEVAGLAPFRRAIGLDGSPPSG